MKLKENNVTLTKPSPALAIWKSFTAQRGVYMTPRVWLLIELDLRFKDHRVACHQMKPLTPEFKVLGQPLNSEVRSMTQK